MTHNTFKPLVLISDSTERSRVLLWLAIKVVTIPISLHRVFVETGSTAGDAGSAGGAPATAVAIVGIWALEKITLVFVSVGIARFSFLSWIRSLIQLCSNCISSDSV